MLRHAIEPLAFHHHDANPPLARETDQILRTMVAARLVEKDLHDARRAPPQATRHRMESIDEAGIGHQLSPGII
jgi:hypothetical protein